MQAQPTRRDTQMRRKQPALLHFLSNVNKEMAMNLPITKVPHLLISFLGVRDERHLVKTVGSGARQPGFECQVYSHGTTGKWLHSVPPQASHLGSGYCKTS